MRQIQGDDLLGVWRTHPADRLGRQVMGLATVEFRADGTLLYTVHDVETDQVSILTYRLDGAWLFTNQPSAPALERTSIAISDAGHLLLEHDGVPARYVRVSQ